MSRDIKLIGSQTFGYGEDCADLTAIVNMAIDWPHDRYTRVSHTHRLVGLVVKASAWRATDPGFYSRFLGGDFCRLKYTSDLKLELQWLPCQAAGNRGSALGFIGPVSVYCDWVR